MPQQFAAGRSERIRTFAEPLVGICAEGFGFNLGMWFFLHGCNDGASHATMACLMWLFLVLCSWNPLEQLQMPTSFEQASLLSRMLELFDSGWMFLRPLVIIRGHFSHKHLNLSSVAASLFPFLLFSFRTLMSCLLDTFFRDIPEACVVKGKEFSRRLCRGH